jgi:hypothetical protein
MCRFSLRNLFLLAAVVALAFGAAPVHAAVYTLGLGNPSISGFLPPYGKVDVTGTDGGGNTAVIELTAFDSTDGLWHYLFGDGGILGLELSPNGTVTASGLNANKVGFPGSTPGVITEEGSGNLDGWGVFNYTLKAHDGFNDAVTYMKFTLTGTAGLWTTDTAVLTNNIQGHVAAAHVFIAERHDGLLTDWTDTQATITGFATVGNPIPEPASVIAWSVLALIGLGYGGWRRRATA